jgi:hypothetical protein
MDQPARADPTMKARPADLDGVPLPMTPANLGKILAEKVDKWGKVLKLSGAKAE